MNCKSPRFQLCQAVVDSLGLQNGEITIVVKNGRALRVASKVAVNVDEPEVMEALKLGPAPSPSSP